METLTVGPILADGNERQTPKFERSSRGLVEPRQIESSNDERRLDVESSNFDGHQVKSILNRD
jgi:hypothetical protein